MSLQKLLLLPTLIRAGMRAPRGAFNSWERFWSGIRRTGGSGDVLWDGASETELDWCRRSAQRLLNPKLPLVDFGAGNGRYAAALAASFPQVVGLDLAPSAIERANAEWRSHSNVSFRVGDLTSPRLGRELGRELGESNVFMRGVLHIMSEREQRAVLANIWELVGERGVLLLLETAFEGSALSYLELLGARNGALPGPLQHCIESGIPRPHCFGRRQFDTVFSPRQWQRIEDGPVDIHAVAMRGDTTAQVIPGFFAAVRRARPSAGDLRRG